MTGTRLIINQITVIELSKSHPPVIQGFQMSGTYSADAPLDASIQELGARLARRIRTGQEPPPANPTPKGEGQ